MDNVGSKRQYFLAYALAISTKRKIELQVALNSDAQPGTFQLDLPDVAFHVSSRQFSAVDRKQWKIVPLRICHQLPSRQRHTINLMEGLAKQRDPRIGGHIPPSSAA